MAEETQKEKATRLMAEKQSGKTTSTDDKTDTDTTPKEKHQSELTEQFKKDNPDKSEEEITTLVNTKLTKETETKNKLTTKIVEIKSRPENKDKTDDEINVILKKELLQPPAKTEDKDTGLPPPEKTKSLNELVKEASKGTFADFDSLLSKANESKGDEFANDQIKHLNELAKNGVDVATVLKYQSLGIDNLDPSDLEQATELIKHELRMKNPGITEKELDYEMKFTYPLELKSESYTDEVDGEEVTKTRVVNTDEVEMSKLKLMRNARVAKEELQKKQKESELPKATNGMSEKETGELKKKWDTQVNDNLKDTTEINFKVGEKGEETFTYKIADVDKLKDTMMKPDRFLSRYFSNGKTDMKRFQQDMLASNEMEQIINSAYEQGKSVGYENAVDGISNLSVSTEGVSVENEPKTPAQTVSKKFKEQVGGF